MGIKTEFLDISSSLHLRRGSLSTAPLDKADKLPFKPVRYVMYSSNRPITAVLNTMVSQGLNILYHCSSLATARSELRKLITRLQHNGMPADKLRRRMLRYIAETAFPGLQYDPRSITAKDLQMQHRRHCKRQRG